MILVTSMFWHALAPNQHHRKMQFQGKAKASLLYSIYRLNRERGLLLTNYSCKRVWDNHLLFLSDEGLGQLKK